MAMERMTQISMIKSGREGPKKVKKNGCAGKKGFKQGLVSKGG